MHRDGSTGCRSTGWDRLRAALLAADSATALLEAWTGGPIRIRRLAGAPSDPPHLRAALGLGPNAPLAYRRVALLRGETLLSEAENWFVPDRLDPRMQALLRDSDVPFGRVVAPLGPRRQMLECGLFATPPASPALCLSALVRDRAGTALAMVNERYGTALLGFLPQETLA
ncbi:MAG: hypothetical protein KGL12_08890 [Rhodospirillales bacterium]|nr:hypothetical protein [Rhodospirillales bacterium]